MTHGDIKIIGHPEEDMPSFWLHAYHDGHAGEAYEDLLHLPQWIVDRAILESYRLDNYDYGNFKKLGTLGPWQLRMMQKFQEEKDKEFDEETFYQDWECNFGVNLNYCGSETIATYMIQRRWDRWIPMREQDAPWHDVGDEPDLLVVCDGEGYDIHPSKSVIKHYEEEIKGVVRVDFAEDLCEAFKQELIKSINKK